MNDGIVYVVSGQSGGRGPFGQEGVKCMGTSASTDYIENYFSECGFAFAEVDSTSLTVSFVNSKGEKKFTGVLTNPFKHGLIDGMADVVSESVFGGKYRSTVRLAMKIAAPLILFTMCMSFFLYNRKFFGFGGYAGGEKMSSSVAIDESTRSNVGLTSGLDMSVSSSHFLNDRNDRF